LQLADKWYSNGDDITADDDDDIASSTRRIFRYPHELVSVYFCNVHPWYLTRPEKQEVAKFFKRPENKLLLERWLDDLEKYMR
jgi:hypothetical protein